ncbi:MAG: ABC transporter [Myxococcales bacterium]|nr:ABC transporter [Myxococcales bacterium]|tara:strand:+ start:1597 stop:2316 length:720 start_codon:yes stop_codon:yes gene_type:complete
MSAVTAIAKREIRSFFNSPMAYITLGVFLLLSGYFYFNTLFLVGQASLREFFNLAPLLFVVFAPALTMRLLAEERKAGTIELLLTMPIRDSHVVFGKFLAALVIVAIGLLLTLPYALSVANLTANNSSFDWGPAVGGYLGLLLMAASFIALGLWASSLSRNQIVGFIIGLLLCFAFYIIDRTAVFLPASMGSVFEFLSVDYHFRNIARGVLDTRDLIFYFSLTGAGLLLTTRTLASSRQ